MVGRTGSIRPEVPRASGSPPEHVLLFFALAGRGIFPARRFQTRMEKLPFGRQVRVFMDALDEFCGVGMSKANASRDLNCVAKCELSICNHCTPPSDRFVSSIVFVGIPGSLRSPFRKRKVWLANQDCTLRRCVRGAGSENEQRNESHQSAYGEYVIELGAARFTIGLTSSLLDGANAGMALGDDGMQDSFRLPSTSRPFQANQRSRRREGHVRGMKLCR